MKLGLVRAQRQLEKILPQMRDMYVALESVRKEFPDEYPKQLAMISDAQRSYLVRHGIRITRKESEEMTALLLALMADKFEKKAEPLNLDALLTDPTVV